MVIYFFFGLWIKTFEVNTISVVIFLITCLIFETLKNKKKTKTLVIHYLRYSKKSMTSQQSKIIFS